jgi:hypothetical protein
MVLFLFSAILLGAPLDKKIERTCGPKPEMAVATQTTKERSGEVEAQARGVATGSTSASSAANTSYEVLVSMDKNEKLLVQWTWCRMKVMDELSDEAFQMMIADLWGTSLPSTPAQSSTESQKPSAQPRSHGAVGPPLAPEELAGTWAVSTVYRGSTCGAEGNGSTSAFTWLLSRGGDGKIAIQVQGETSFPKLSGTYEEGRMVLQGLMYNGNWDKNQAHMYKKQKDAYTMDQHYLFPKKWHEIQVTEDGQMSGQALTEMQDQPHQAGQVFWSQPCTHFFDLTGKKIH